MGHAHKQSHLIRIEAEEMRDFIGFLFREGVDCQTMSEEEARELFLKQY